MQPEDHSQSAPNLPNPPQAENEAEVLGGVLRIAAFGCIPMIVIVIGIVLVTSGSLRAVAQGVNDFLFSLGGLPLVLVIVGAFMAVAAIGSRVTRQR